ncbi:MAG: NAD-dependent epimerase/dehydratase family protein [Legionella sp.]|nr:NAD-dependent epimerase/dehydratase family protein [Legionella sp.]
MTKKILVLGGNGFIGSHLIDALLDKKYMVRVFDKASNALSNHIDNSNFEMIKGDLTNEVDMTHALADCDICFHLISTVLPKSSNLNPVFDIETNLMGSVKLLNLAVKANIKKIIFLSSGGTVYGLPMQLPIDENHPTNPLCSYGITKLAFEKYLHLYHQLYGLDYTILRLANPFGERQRTEASQGAVAVFLGKALRKEKIEIWGDGSIIRDYIHISDVVNAMLRAIPYENAQRILNIGSGHGLSLNEILDNIELVTGNKLVRAYTDTRKFDVPINILNSSRAKKALDWTPALSFKEGLIRMADSLKGTP